MDRKNPLAKNTDKSDGNIVEEVASNENYGLQKQSKSTSTEDTSEYSWNTFSRDSRDSSNSRVIEPNSKESQTSFRKEHNFEEINSKKC